MGETEKRVCFDSFWALKLIYSVSFYAYFRLDKDILMWELF